MKKLLLLLVLCAPFISRAQVDTTSTLTKVGDVAPTFTFSLDKTKTANLADYKGKIVVLDFLGHLVPPLPCGTAPRTKGNMGKI